MRWQHSNNFSKSKQISNSTLPQTILAYQKILHLHLLIYFLQTLLSFIERSSWCDPLPEWRSQCPFDIFHLPHSGRGSQQLLLSRTDTFDLVILCLKVWNLVLVCENGLRSTLYPVKPSLKRELSFFPGRGAVCLRRPVIDFFQSLGGKIGLPFAYGKYSFPPVTERMHPPSHK